MVLTASGLLVFLSCVLREERMSEARQNGVVVDGLRSSGGVGADRGAHRPRVAKTVGLLFRNLHLLREVKIVKLCHACNLHALTSTDCILNLACV